jgi:SAM-dependent methyltransferase
LDYFAFSSYEARKNHSEIQACWQQGGLLTKAIVRDKAHVYCPLCDKIFELRLIDEATDYREQLCCPSCKLNSRIRAALSMLGDSAPEASNIYMTEQATPAFAWMQKRHPRVSGSEFEPSAVARRELATHLHSLGGTGEIQFQDVTALSNKSETLDAILSFDVLEHVPDYEKALREFSRVLKPGGVCLATFPFTDAAKTLVRARLTTDGGVEHLMEPEFHGDPISGGVLCFYHFGWDLLEVVKGAGFKSAQMVMPWAPQRGFYYGLWTLVALR